MAARPTAIAAIAAHRVESTQNYLESAGADAGDKSAGTRGDRG